MKRRSLIIILMLSAGFISANAKATMESMTIATFADPSQKGGTPLFTVDFTLMKLTGGWGDDKTGLTLITPGDAFEDAWFKMSDVTITNPAIIPGVGKSGWVSGAINFYANNTSATPLVTIEFESAFVSRYDLSGSDEMPEGGFIAENVTITGSAIPYTLSEEQFSFSFANVAKLQGHTSLNDGFTATAAFTSSAIEIVGPPVPEPATLCILGLGALRLIRRKKRKGGMQIGQ